MPAATAVPAATASPTGHILPLLSSLRTGVGDWAIVDVADRGAVGGVATFD
eukprot:gene813-3337_t